MPSIFNPEPSGSPTPAPRKPSAFKGWLMGLLGGLALLGGKLKFLLIFLKFGKVLLTASTMLLSIGAYALIMPVPFAIGFVLLIFLHELGHLFALSRYGLKASAPIFLPFVGAMIAMKDMPKNAEMEAVVGFGGPLAGYFAALGCLGLYQLTAVELFLQLAHLGAFMNLFNLIPVSPLDGGRVTAAISKWFWIVGLLLLLTWFLLGNHQPILLLILLLGVLRAVQVFRTPPEGLAYYTVSPTVRLTLAAAYITLVVLLVQLSLYTHERILDIRPI